METAQQADSFGDLLLNLGSAAGYAWINREFGEQPQSPPMETSNPVPQPTSVNNTPPPQGGGIVGLGLAGLIAYAVFG